MYKTGITKDSIKNLASKALDVVATWNKEKATMGKVITPTINIPASEKMPL